MKGWLLGLAALGVLVGYGVLRAIYGDVVTATLIAAMVLVSVVIRFACPPDA